MKIIIIPQSDALKWNETILKSTNYDFYHCNSYHQLDFSGEAFLFVAEADNDFIALPLIKRKINNSDYFDCTSVYGYSGPVSNLDVEKISEEFINFFQTELTHFLSQEKIVSVFSRLHPIIDQTKLLEGLGNIIPLNKTVSIDLRIPVDEQRRQYRKSNKSEINQLKRKGYLIKKATTEEQIDSFVDIYVETMKRVNAAELYFFDRAYFHTFLKSSEFNSDLLLAYFGTEITAGAIFTTTKHIMQYHLAGTKSTYMKETPMKLIIDEARLIGSESQLKYLHLGGGVSGQDEDPLFKFKSGFSELNFRFSIWKYIVNQEIYDRLSDELPAHKKINVNYFPLYRA